MIYTQLVELSSCRNGVAIGARPVHLSRGFVKISSRPIAYSPRACLLAPLWSSWERRRTAAAFEKGTAASAARSLAAAQSRATFGWTARSSLPSSRRRPARRFTAGWLRPRQPAASSHRLEKAYRCAFFCAIGLALQPRRSNCHNWWMFSWCCAFEGATAATKDLEYAGRRSSVIGNCSFNLLE